MSSKQKDGIQLERSFMLRLPEVKAFERRKFGLTFEALKKTGFEFDTLIILVFINLVNIKSTYIYLLGIDHQVKYYSF